MRKIIMPLLAGILFLTGCSFGTESKVTARTTLFEGENLSVRKMQYEDDLWSMDIDVALKGISLSSKAMNNLEQMEEAVKEGITLSDGSTRAFSEQMLPRMKQKGLGSYEELERLLDCHILQGVAGAYQKEGNQIGLFYDTRESVVSVDTAQQEEGNLITWCYMEMLADPSKDTQMSMRLSGSQEGEYLAYTTDKGIDTHLLYCLEENQAQAYLVEEGILYCWEFSPVKGDLKLEQIKEFLDTIS